jgi:hypothetical protein
MARGVFDAGFIAPPSFPEEQFCRSTPAGQPGTDHTSQVFERIRTWNVSNDISATCHH